MFFFSKEMKMKEPFCLLLKKTETEEEFAWCVLLIENTKEFGKLTMLQSINELFFNFY